MNDGLLANLQASPTLSMHGKILCSYHVVTTIKQNIQQSGEWIATSEFDS